MGKIGQIDTTSRKFFQHVIHHLMSKIGPFGNLFRNFFSNCFARVSTVIDHPCESYLPASPPVSRSILPAALLCKNRGKVETLFENFLIRSVQHRLQRVLSSYGQRSFHLPSISTWRKSAILETPEQKKCQHEARAVNCPTLFNVKI